MKIITFTFTRTFIWYKSFITIKLASSIHQIKWWFTLCALILANACAFGACPEALFAVIQNWNWGISIRASSLLLSSSEAPWICDSWWWYVDICTLCDITFTCWNNNGDKLCAFEICKLARYFTSVANIHIKSIIIVSWLKARVCTLENWGILIDNNLGAKHCICIIFVGGKGKENPFINN